MSSAIGMGVIIFGPLVLLVGFTTYYMCTNYTSYVVIKRNITERNNTRCVILEQIQNAHTAGYITDIQRNELLAFAKDQYMEQ